MAKRGVLRGRGSFAQVIQGGRSVSTATLRGTYVVREREGGFLRYGISVPRRAGNAVRRNRIKRLIREAVRLERSNIQLALESTRFGVDVVFRFRPVGDPPRQLSLVHVKPEVQKILLSIIAKVNQKAP